VADGHRARYVVRRPAGGEMRHPSGHS
jgi:hypothetical protein